MNGDRAETLLESLIINGLQRNKPFRKAHCANPLSLGNQLVSSGNSILESELSRSFRRIERRR